MITGTFNTAYGVVTVEVDAGTATGQILSVGSIKYEFDITPDSVVIDRLMAVYQRFDVSWLLNTDDGQDLYDLFTAGDADVTVTIAGYDGNTYTFPFMLKQYDVSISEKDRTVKTSFSVPFDTTITVRNVWDNIFANYVSSLFLFHSGGTDYNAVPAKLWIQVCLWMMRGGTGAIGTGIEFDSVELANRVTTPSDFGDYTYDDIDVVDSAFDGKFCLCAIDTDGIVANGNFVDLLPAVSALQSMAGYEGGVFGYGFSSLFYQNRTVGYTDAQTISYDEVLSLSFATNYKAFQSITIGSVATSFNAPDNHLPNFPTQDATSGTLNLNAEKSVLIRLQPGYPVMQLGIIDSVTNLRVDAIAGTTAEDANEGYLNASVDSYNLALPASGALVIEATLYGFGRVKPWETFQLFTDAPVRYQGKKFRINSAEYDIVQNQTKVRAYEVDSYLSWYALFSARVIADSGSITSASHTKDVFFDVFPYSPSLVCPCTAGKASVLYSHIP
jgi:hypothetical protein